MRWVALCTDMPANTFSLVTFPAYGVHKIVPNSHHFPELWAYSFAFVTCTSIYQALCPPSILKSAAVIKLLPFPIKNTAILR